VTEPRGEPGAVLRPDVARQRIQITRHHPRDSLRPFVDYLWVVRWDVDKPYTQSVLTQPKVHLAAEDGRLRVYGVSRRVFRRRLTGRDKAIGLAFRPGGFRPFLSPAERVGSLQNKVVGVNDLWNVDDGAIARRTLAEADDDAMVRCIEDFLQTRHPVVDPVAEQAADLVDLIERERGMRRVDELAATSGIGVRALQRLFREYVGAAPKWVIQRRRLLDAAERVHAGEQVAWAELAGELGYSDQAHLVRDFSAAVGTSPAAYAKTVTGASVVP
jgi:AraC-like DNA-binding protein